MQDPKRGSYTLSAGPKTQASEHCMVPLFHTEVEYENAPFSESECLGDFAGIWGTVVPTIFYGPLGFPLSL